MYTCVTVRCPGDDDFPATFEIIQLPQSCNASDKAVKEFICDVADSVDQCLDTLIAVLRPCGISSGCYKLQLEDQLPCLVEWCGSSGTDIINCFAGILRVLTNTNTSLTDLNFAVYFFATCASQQISFVDCAEAYVSTCLQNQTIGLEDCLDVLSDSSICTNFSEAEKINCSLQLEEAIELGLIRQCSELVNQQDCVSYSNYYPDSW